MGACFHLPGVTCDNCRTTLKGDYNERFAKLWGEDRQEIRNWWVATAKERDELRAEVERLRRAIEAVVAHQDRTTLGQIGSRESSGNFHRVPVADMARLTAALREGGTNGQRV